MVSKGKIEGETMKYGYEVYPVNDTETRYWIAQSRALIKNGIQSSQQQRTVYGQGNTKEEAVKDLDEKETKWIEMAEFCGLKIIEPEKKAVSSQRLSWRKRSTLIVAFLLCLAFGASSAVIDYKLLIGFFASLFFTAFPMELFKLFQLKYTSFGYMSPLDKYHQYLEVFEQSEKLAESLEEKA